jgi:hypothetical protein
MSAAPCPVVRIILVDYCFKLGGDCPNNRNAFQDPEKTITRLGCVHYQDNYKKVRSWWHLRLSRRRYQKNSAGVGLSENETRVSASAAAIFQK